MAAKLVWLKADGTLTCGHSLAVGYPGPVDGEWFCTLCAAHVDAQLDQELAAAAEAARRDRMSPVAGGDE
jgi:hypothetical protein